MRITSRRFNEALREAKQLLNAIDPELTQELTKEIKAKIIRKITSVPEQADQLDQLTIKNILYSLLLKKYLNKDNKCLHNNPTFKPRYWLKRCEFINSQEKNLS
nr:MAG TPA: hypothetical protein [Caudoviricetes sp.]